MRPHFMLPVIGLTLAACTQNTSTDAGAGAIEVTSSDTACEVMTAQAPSGTLAFHVRNTGSDVSEFYLLGDDGLRIIGEVENIGPGLTRDLVVTAQPGKYFTSCDPGMNGDEIRATFTVNDSGTPLRVGAASEQLQLATTAYAKYVERQTSQLLTSTEAFAQAYASGDDEQARALYAPTRVHWERIEPVAESFGDLDPKLDLREADLEEGQRWTGWHAIEKDLWPPASGYTALTPKLRQRLADQLVTDTADLDARVQDLTYTPDQLSNGAKELLDEVATGKVTGEEEIWSHTDLWDFQANVDGARIAFEELKPVVETKNPELADALTMRFTALQDLLDHYREPDGFVLYTDLTQRQVKELSAAVNALSEPLSQLTSTVLL